jgi:hypothetical protein
VRAGWTLSNEGGRRIKDAGKPGLKLNPTIGGKKIEYPSNKLEKNLDPHDKRNILPPYFY